MQLGMVNNNGDLKGGKGDLLWYDGDKAICL